RWNRDRFVQTQLEILASRPLHAEVLRRFGAAGYEDEALEADLRSFADILVISPRENSELIEISIEHPDPEKAAALANLMSEAYREYNLEGLRDAARDARVWLELQVADYESRIDRISADV